MVYGIKEIAALTKDLMYSEELVAGYYDFKKEMYCGERLKAERLEEMLPDYLYPVFTLHAEMDEETLQEYIDEEAGSPPTDVEFEDEDE